MSRLGVADQATVTDQVEGLIEINGRVVFRHPLVRSAAYRAATAKDRRAAHGALAAVTTARADVDRRAWHRAAASGAPDESVARALEESATQAQSRGGLAAAAAFLQRSVVLTQDMTRHADRALAAADASLQAGDLEAARHSLELAELDACSDGQRARSLALRGQLLMAVGRPKDAVPLLLDAARQLEPCRPRPRRTDLSRGLGCGGRGRGRTRPAVHLPGHRGAAGARGWTRPIHQPLRGYALLAHGSRSAGVEALHRVVPVVTGLSAEDLLRWGRLTAGLGPLSMWDGDLTVVRPSGDRSS